MYELHRVGVPDRQTTPAGDTLNEALGVLDDACRQLHEQGDTGEHRFEIWNSDTMVVTLTCRPDLSGPYESIIVHGPVESDEP